MGFSAAGWAAIGIVSAISAGSAIYQGTEQRKSSKRSLARQREAQDAATREAISAKRQKEMTERAANRKTPDVSALLGEEQRRGGLGAPSTMLTGPTGVQRNNLLLGGAGKLGT